MQIRDINILNNLISNLRENGILDDITTKKEKKLKKLMGALENKISEEEFLNLENAFEDYKRAIQWEQFKLGSICGDVIENTIEEWKPKNL